MKSVERVARSEKHAIRKHGILLNSRLLKEGRETEESRGSNEWGARVEGRKGRRKEKRKKKLWGRKRKALAAVTRYDIFIIIHNAEHLEHSRSVKSLQRKFLQEALLGAIVISEGRAHARPRLLLLFFSIILRNLGS